MKKLDFEAIFLRLLEKQGFDAERLRVLAKGNTLPVLPTIAGGGTPLEPLTPVQHTAQRQPDPSLFGLSPSDPFVSPSSVYKRPFEDDFVDQNKRARLDDAHAVFERLDGRSDVVQPQMRVVEVHFGKVLDCNDPSLAAKEATRAAGIAWTDVTRPVEWIRPSGGGRSDALVIRFRTMDSAENFVRAVRRGVSGVFMGKQAYINKW